MRRAFGAFVWREDGSGPPGALRGVSGRTRLGRAGTAFPDGSGACETWEHTLAPWWSVRPPQSWPRESSKRDVFGFAVSFPVVVDVQHDFVLTSG